MKLTYNKNIGDVLLVSLKGSDNFETKDFDGYTTIVDNDELLGLNIFNASETFTEEELKELNEEPIVEKINEIIKDDLGEINPDLSPKFVVGYVKECKPHEDADRLNVTTVDVGDEELQIVCGAPNVDKGQKVVVAKVGAFMPNGLYIKPSELRGVKSNGMICSKKELNLEDDGVRGIYVLDDNYEVGQPFFK
ncbi:tRNA-binding protein [Nosocomiicoccus sp. HMSC067E10]|uniref:YtpR family tRNA-binding protein n=1 Tax=Nosocomiicoccus sp. HMSC067E10 TaxID=1739271 RepID=UPI0008A5C2DE|nr:tRNA-binding protein [Nosocomiicoccus sp. HMSC067E10]OFL46291.1 tRNA-binding protein [Nosocomiicoccus sp. HMSC067E10]